MYSITIIVMNLRDNWIYTRLQREATTIEILNWVLSNTLDIRTVTWCLGIFFLFMICVHCTRCAISCMSSHGFAIHKSNVYTSNHQIKFRTTVLLHLHFCEHKYHFSRIFVSTTICTQLSRNKLRTYILDDLCSNRWWGLKRSSDSQSLLRLLSLFGSVDTGVKYGLWHNYPWQWILPDEQSYSVQLRMSFRNLMVFLL